MEQNICVQLIFSFAGWIQGTNYRWRTKKTPASLGALFLSFKLGYKERKTSPISGHWWIYIHCVIIHCTL